LNRLEAIVNPRPNTNTARLTNGAGISATSVSGQSTHSITLTDSTSVSDVSNQYMTPGPSIIRTAFMSLVARARISPVRMRL